MRSLSLLMVFACTLTCAALAQQPAWSRVAAVDVHRADGGGFASGGTCYRFPAQEIPTTSLPADAGERDILYGDRLTFRFAGLRAAARYELRVQLLSDSEARVVRVMLDGKVLEDGLRLPNGKVLAESWPMAPTPTGMATFVLRRTGGANAAVCAVEVWSTDPTPLTTPPPLEPLLRSMAVPLPQLAPRPDYVAGVVEPRLRLDGTWRFAPAAPENIEQVTATHAAAWAAIEVPGEWAMQGFAVAAGKPAAYFREFTRPDDWQGKVVRLRFHTVHSRCTVWLNGTRLGEHEGCFAPFEFDVTQAIVPGTNRLTLAVTSESLADTLASATQYAAHPLGGITRKVELFALPVAHVANATLDADYDAARGHGTLHASFDVQGSMDLRVSVHDAMGRLLGAQLAKPAAGRLSLPIDLPGIAAWDPEHPRLYTVRVVTIDGENVLARSTHRVGFRRIEVRGNRVFVNNQPIKLKGACRHEVHPTRGRSLTPELWRLDAQQMRDANCNYVRTSHYPPAEEFLDACDELGLFVECEAALCWVQHGANEAWQDLDSEDPALLPALLAANFANVITNRSHPSVLIWSLANESRWSPLFAEVNRRVKALDPSRPTSFHDQCWGEYNNAHSTADIAVYHYPGEDGPARCDQESRPVLFGEYCHVQCYNRRELAADPGVREDWGRGFLRMSELMQQHDGCLGGAIWAAFDDVFCLPDGKTVGYGEWGCIADGWRRSKPETLHVQRGYAPVRIDHTSLQHPYAGTVPIENRFDFTDLREVTICWRSHGQEGKVAIALAPHARGELGLPKAAREPVLLTFTDARGVICAEEMIGTAAASLDSNAAKDGVWHAEGERVVDGKVGEHVVVTGGPDFMLLPLSNEACQPVDLGVWPPLNDLATADIATGHFALHADGARLRVQYEFTAAKDINPRQWGAVIWIERSCELLSWDRDELSAVYPAYHIGRLSDFALPRVQAIPAPYPASNPGGPWSLDATPLGGHDFTATRTHVRTAALHSRVGFGVRVVGDGTTAVRAFVDGERIGLLIAGFHTGGGDGFFATHFAKERRPLKKGDRMSGAFELELVSR